MYGQGNFSRQFGQGPPPPPPLQPHVGQSQPAAPAPAQQGQAGQLYLNPTPPPPPPPLAPPLRNAPPVHSYSNTHQNFQWAPNMYQLPPPQGLHHNLPPPPPPPPPFSPPPGPPPPPHSESGPSLSQHSGRVADVDDASNHDHPTPPPKPRDENIVRKIEVLCQYIVKNGPDFEDMTLQKEFRNPEFDFLFGGEPGSEAELAHEYFLWMKRNLTNQEQQHDDSSLQFDSLVEAGVAPSPADSDMDMEDDITQPVEEPGVGNKPFESPSHGSDLISLDNDVRVENLVEDTEFPSSRNLEESSISTHKDSIQVSGEPNPVKVPSEPDNDDNSPFRLVQDYDSDDSSENVNDTFLEDLSPTKVDTPFEEVGPDLQTDLACKSLDSSTELETVPRKPDPESTQVADKSHGHQESTDGGTSKQKNATSGTKTQRIDEFGRLVREGASESESDNARQRQSKRRDKRRRSRSRSRSRDRRRRSPRRRKDKRSRSRSWSPRKRSRSRSPYKRGSEFGGRRDKGQLPDCFDFRRGKCYRGASCRYLHHESDKTDGFKSKSPYKEIPESNISDLYEKDVIENVTPDRNDKSLVNLVAESERAQEVTEALDIEKELVEQQQQNNGNGTSWIQQSEQLHHNSDNQTPQMMNDLPNLPPPPPRDFNVYHHQHQPSIFYQPSLFSAPPNTSWQFLPPPPPLPLSAPLGVFQPNLVRPYIADLPAQRQSTPQFGGPTNPLQQQNMPFFSQPAIRMQSVFGDNVNSTFSRFPSHYNPYASTFDQSLSSKFTMNNTFNQEQATSFASLGSKDQYDPVFDSVEPSKSVQGKNPELIDESDSILRASGSNKPVNLVEKKHKEEASMENDEYGETAGAVENGSPSEPIDDDEATTPPAGEIEIDQEVKSNSQGKNNKSGKDSRSMKLFKNSLADFVKEVLKPSWRQGNMSKEAFKTIVKKTVDKVSGAMKAHQIPKSQPKINHYIDSNQRKLTKLVMGYVDKYVKS